jgi:hypothetical protein
MRQAGKAFPLRPAYSPSVPLPQGLATPATPPILCAVANERSLSAAGADRDRTSVQTTLRTRPGFLGGAAAKHSCARTPHRLRPDRERDLSLDPPVRRISRHG